MTTSTLRFAVVFCVGLLTACQSASPVAPSPTGPTLTGAWAGEFVGTTVVGTGTGQAMLTQEGDAVSGTWSITTQTGIQLGGTVNGTVAEQSTTLMLEIPNVCTVSAPITFTETDLTGSWTTPSGGCTLVPGTPALMDTGTLNFTRQ